MSIQRACLRGTVFHGRCLESVPLWQKTYEEKVLVGWFFLPQRLETEENCRKTKNALFLASRMSNTNPSDLLYSLFSGFPEDEGLSPGRRWNVKMRLGNIYLSVLLLLMKHLLRYSNISSTLFLKSYLEVSFLNIYP